MRRPIFSPALACAVAVLAMVFACCTGAPVLADPTARVVGACGTASYTAGKFNYPTIDAQGRACGGADGDPVMVVSTCGTASYTAGKFNYPTADTTGVTCTNQGGTYVYPVLSLTGSAATNTALVNGALAGGGRVTLGCGQAGTAYFNAPLIIYSNVQLDTGNCHMIEATGQNTNLLVNHAYTQSFTTLQINSGLIANGPLSLIWSGSAPAWVASTTYATGAYVNNGGNLYWASVGGTAAGSGGPTTCTGSSTGPTGTKGGAITDNTVTWYCVTSWPLLNTTSATAFVYVPSHGLQVGSVVTLTPTPDVPATNRQWTGMQTAQTNGAYADTAFFGTFKVGYVPDANWIVVSLNRQPGLTGTIKPWPLNTSVALNELRVDPNGVYQVCSAGTTANSGSGPSGTTTNCSITDSGATWNFFSTIPNFGNFTGAPIDFKVADQNIVINGNGVFDCVNVSASGLAAHCTLFAGLYNADINVGVESATKYELDAFAVTASKLRVWTGPNGSNSDGLKLWGPSINVTAEAVCLGADDCGSFQTDVPSAFANQDYTCCDIINSTLTTFGDGLTTVLYPEGRYGVVDQVTFKGCTHNNQTASRASVEIDGETTPGGYIGTFIDEGGCNRDNAVPFNLNPLSGGYTADNVILRNVSAMQGFQANPTTTPLSAATMLGLVNLTGITVHHLRIENSHCWAGNNTVNAPCVFIALGSGLIDEMEFVGGTANSYYLNGGYFLEVPASVTVPNRISIDGLDVFNVGTIARLYTATDLTLSNVLDYSTSAGATPQGVTTNVAGNVLHFNHNTFNGITNGVVRYGGVYATTIYSDGTNTLNNGSVWVGNPGGSNANLVGSLYSGLTELAAVNVPVVSSCGSGSSLGTNANDLAGTITVPAATTTCTYSFHSQDFPFNPRGCIGVAPSATLVTVGCTVSWTSATSGTFSLIASANASGEALTYSILP